MCSSEQPYIQSSFVGPTWAHLWSLQALSHSHPPTPCSSSRPIFTPIKLLSTVGWNLLSTHIKRSNVKRLIDSMTIKSRVKMVSQGCFLLALTPPLISRRLCGLYELDCMLVGEHYPILESKRNIKEKGKNEGMRKWESLVMSWKVPNNSLEVCLLVANAYCTCFYFHLM